MDATASNLAHMAANSTFTAWSKYSKQRRMFINYGIVFDGEVLLLGLVMPVTVTGGPEHSSTMGRVV